MSEAPPTVGGAPPGGGDAPPPAPQRRAGGKHEKQRSGALGFLKELPGLIIIAFLLALLIKTFLVQAFFIPSESMLPTFEVGDRVLVFKLSDELGGFERGDIVVFENPLHEEPDRNPFSAFWHWLTEGLGVTSDPQKDFIKRVIAVEGDTIEIRNGVVWVNGDRVAEPYRNRQDRDRSDMDPTRIEQDELFVMGDNRAASQDSRYFGSISEDRVVGKAFVLLWPLSRWDWL